MNGHDRRFGLPITTTTEMVWSCLKCYYGEAINSTHGKQITWLGRMGGICIEIKFCCFSLSHYFSVYITVVILMMYNLGISVCTWWTDSKDFGYCTQATSVYLLSIITQQPDRFLVGNTSRSIIYYMMSRLAHSSESTTWKQATVRNLLYCVKTGQDTTLC